MTVVNVMQTPAPGTCSSPLAQQASEPSAVPGSCTAYGDCRLMPGVEAAQVEALIRERLVRLPGVDYSLRTLVAVPAVEISPDERIVSVFARAAQEVTGRELPRLGAGPWNDAWMFITGGIPTICGYGPAGENPHAANEFVFVDSIIETTRIYARAVISYLGARTLRRD